MRIDRFSNFTADDACKRMCEIRNTYSSTQKRKKVAKNVHVTIRTLQLKLAKRKGEESEFLEWLKASDLDKELIADIKKKKINEKEINWLHTLIREIQNTKSCSMKTRTSFNYAWSAVERFWNEVDGE